jgi:6-phosphogluconolactonase
VDWERTDVFWGDERCVPTGDDRSNATMARETLLSRVPVPPERIRPIHCHENPAQGARQYENLLKRHFGDGPVCFDLIFLGLGENGHTASLFPETPALEEKEKLVSEVRVAGEDFCRVTLTAPAINRAATVAVLVSGISKASVLRDVLEGPRDPDRLPAQLIHPLGGQMLWLIDREAASCLERVS